MIENVLKFINYWYFRYLLITELYMVEKWERLMIHIVFFIIFSIISLFNYTVTMGLVSWMIDGSLYGGTMSDGSSHLDLEIPEF